MALPYSESDTDKMIQHVEHHYEMRRTYFQWCWHAVNFLLPVLSLSRCVPQALLQDQNILILVLLVTSYFLPLSNGLIPIIRMQ